jgi:hypothetical protein
VGMAGIGIAIIGGAVVGFADAGQGGAASARGDVLALLGALSASGYLLLGRRLRARMSLPLYVGIVYVTAAVALFLVVGITGLRLSAYPPSGYLWVLLLALGPQLVGHTSYNYALKYVSATFVTVTLLAEPIGATFLPSRCFRRSRPGPASSAASASSRGSCWRQSVIRPRPCRGKRLRPCRAIGRRPEVRQRRRRECECSPCNQSCSPVFCSLRQTESIFVGASFTSFPCPLVSPRG